MVQRLSKMDAARVLQVHHSTIDRMIQRGELQVEREGLGRRPKVWVLVDDPPADTPDGSSSDSWSAQPGSANATPSARPGLANGSSPTVVGEPGDIAAEVELATIKERAKSLEELVEYQRKQLVDADWRYQQVLDQLASSQRISENLSRPLAAGGATGDSLHSRRWWPFRKAQN